MKRDGLDALGERYGLDSSAVDALARVLDALAREPSPPTTIADPGGALDIHVADSLTALEVPALASAGRIADLGSGAGFPGLPLAIALPHARVDLIESSRGKCAVIERLAAAAGAGNAHALPARAEDWGRAATAGDDGGAEGETGRGAYDAVTARALAPLAVLVEYAAPLLREGGVLVAWKGARNEGEEGGGRAAAAEVGLELDAVRHVTPFPDARDHHLHIYAKATPTPARFPRRTGVAAKRPLA